MKNFVSPTSHPASFLTGSTLESMIDKASELNTGYVTCTDNGYLTDTFKAYNYAKEKGLKPILGCEIYVVDRKNLLYTGTQSDKIKYFTITLHAKNQNAYQYLVKKLSEENRSTIEILEQEYPVFTWDDLEDFSKQDFTAVVGGPQCIVCKNLLVEEKMVAFESFKKLKELFGSNLYASIIPMKFDKKWVTSSVFTFVDGETVTLDSTIMAETDYAKTFRVPLKEVADKHGKHKSIKKIYVNGIGYKVNRDIASACNHKDFKSMGTDVYETYNKFMKAFCERYKVPMLINDYSYLAKEDDKLVQDLKLGEEIKLYTNHHICNINDVLPVLSNIYNTLEIKNMIENSYEWASKFDNFELKYDYQLVKEHNDHLKATLDLIKEVGRFDESNPVHRERLQHEIKVIHANGQIDLLPYFFPISRVLKHYTDMGRIVGPARGCLTKDTLVYTNNGVKNLDKIKVGDYVISHTGQWRKVLDTMVYDINEELLNIKTQYSYNSNTMTKDHKVYGIKRTVIDGHTSKTKKYENWNEKDVKWYKAEEMEEGDLLFTPWPNKVRNEIEIPKKIDIAKYFKNKKYDDNYVYIEKPLYNEFSLKKIAKSTGLAKSVIKRLKENGNCREYNIKKIEEYLLKYNTSIEEWQKNKNIKTLKIKRFINFDKKLCNFIGRWIGDGWLTRQNNGIGICFNTDEKEDVKYYISYLKSLGWDIYENKSKNKKLVQYTVKNSEIWTLFRKMFPNYNFTSNSKHMSFWKKTPKKYLKWILEGLLGADGHVRNNRQSSFQKESIDTTSKILAEEVRESLLTLKIPSSIFVRESFVRKQKNKEYLCKKSYKISFAGIKIERSNHFNFSTKKGYFSKITNISKKTDDRVYDITVEKDHSYTTVDYVVHNSAGGSFLMYCMGITQIDPIKYGLYFSRFLTLGRILSGSLPDVDVDIPDRNLLVGPDGFLECNYTGRWAQVSTRTMMKLKSSIRDVNRFFKGSVEDEIEKLAKNLEATPQGISDKRFVFGYENDEGEHVDGLIDKDEKLQKYAKERPDEWEVVKRTLGISRQNGRHACFAAGTLVDSNGKVDFIDLSPEFADKKPIKTWYSGVKDTVVVSMNNGVSIQCTPDHRFMVGNKEVEAKDLKDKTVSYKPFSNTSGQMTYNSDYCFAWGWFLNDGAYIVSSNGDERFEFYFTPEKDDEAKERILSFWKKCGKTVTPDKKRKDTYKVYGLDFNFKIKQKTHNKRLPKNFWELDLRCQRNFMCGLFSANGYCLSNRPTVAIKLTSKLLISDIAVWLNSKDINTSCSYSKSKEIEHHNGVYTSKSTATLTIPHFTNKIAFENLVGFFQTYKSDRLRQIIEEANNTKYTPNKVKCLYVEEFGKAPVWDFNEPLENVGYINGVLVHNCAFVISDKPITETIPTMTVAGHNNITQYEAKEVEAAGLLKYDFLVVKCLNDIELALKYINKKFTNAGNIYNPKAGYFYHKSGEIYIWDLPEEPEVFNMLAEGKTETIFQLNTTSVTPYVMKMKPRSVEDCAVVTSLVRPGPLDFIDEDTGRNMAEEYIERRHGRSKGEIPILDELIPETFGVMCIAKGSKVKTLDGQVNIEDVKEGSLVQVETGEYRRVLKNIYQGKKETIKIRLDNSEELNLTCDHKVLTQRGWVEASDLTKNDLIKHFWVSDENIEEGSDVDWVIGMLLADGQLGQTTYNIAAGTQENALKIKEIVDKTFNINCQTYHHTRCWYVRTTNKDHNNKVPNEDRKNPLREYCKSIGLDGLNCYNKTFPKKITKKMIEGFVEGDGNVKNKRIRICNEKMARQIFETLQAMRVKSNLFNDNGVWTVGFNQEKLSYKIKEKQREVEKDIYIPKEKCKLSRSDDRRQHFTPKKMEDKPFIQRSLVKSIASDYGFGVSEQTWSKVLKIEEDTVRDVYDLSIEDIHSFVVGGNVVHNCFQEQITKMTKELTGWDDEKAEDVRIAVGKKKLKMIQELKPQFIESSVKNGIEQDIAQSVWGMIETFGRYGFNKSHAVAYSMIAYACAYLKYHYPLEWWAAVLSNAEEKEITEVLWPYVKDILSPPDINLSQEEMVIDYRSGKIRNKLSVLKGLGPKVANKIIEGRPYVDIHDFVQKEAVGNSLARKLIHVGVIDSLFPSEYNLMEKMQLFEDAVSIWEYKKKMYEKSDKEISLEQNLSDFIEAAKNNPKTKRCKHVISQGKIDLKYAFMNPIKDFILKKSIFPTMPVKLHDIIKTSAKSVNIINTNKSSFILNKIKREVRFVDGKIFQDIKNLPVQPYSSLVVDFCVAGYVIECKEFSYKNGEKKALKIIVDIDGQLEEFVKWPDYETGVLDYPSNLKNNSVVFLFMNRKMNREKYHTNIENIVVEEIF